ncbi:MAG: PstS family phosphate ABC transporter substrate-binding protein [Actinobacteria bacterium]|nr:PstS family phosphate ABC transporter substrate-binding protein [Actinomycetota bacterium]MDQ3425000.1 PstS family phosphate ABC transporter substrate-binding protein [Actinomycetota bacterium]
MKSRRSITLLLSMAALALVAAGCGGGDGGGGTISADGSSTVGPFVTKAAEDFKDAEGVDITVGISGTGGGFERFCAGETDLSNASRPIDEDEQALCADAGVEYIEFRIATDALTNVVNMENDWATCLTVDQLETIWGPGSKVTNWNQVDPSFPDVELTLFGPGTDSGTFDYFTGVINGEEGASRTDFSPSEDDNVIVQGVSGDRGGLGYFGFSYYEQNQATLEALEVDGGSGCVAPSAEAAQDGSYTPLSRPLYVYVKRSSFDDKEDVRNFVLFMLDQNSSIAEAAQFVPLSDEQLAEERSKLEEATG